MAVFVLFVALLIGGVVLNHRNAAIAQTGVQISVSASV